MSLTDTISGDLQAMAAGVNLAQQHVIAVDHVVEQIAAWAVASGFAGIGIGLVRVRETTGQARVRLTSVGEVIAEAGALVRMSRC